MIMNRRVVVTGIGVLAAPGNDRETFFDSIINGISGLGHIKLFDMSDLRTQVAGEVKYEFDKLENEEGLERTILLAYKALDEALIDSNLTKEQIQKLGSYASLSFSTSLGGNLRMMEHIKRKINNENSSPKWLSEIPKFISYIADRAGVKGAIYTTMSACAAGTAGAGIALEEIRNGNSDLVIIGGADPLTRFSSSGFHSIKSLSAKSCKPFDKNRDGMSIGEGSAFFVVETLERANERNAHIYGEILGYGISNDAFHITSPDPNGSGACRAMTAALKDANLVPKDIDYINAHGTATFLNDKMELKTIKKMFLKDNPNIAISSTKSMTGHCLGAAGSIELAICLLSVDRGIVPPTSSLEDVEEEFEDLNIISKKGINQEVNVAMSNSFAFAGNAASIIVGKYNGV